MFPSNTDYDTKVTLESDAMLVEDDLPFHILLLGDWSGKESRSAENDSPKFKPVEIDRDNFDEVLGKLNVKLGLHFQDDEDNALFLDFKELEDFHPDNIFRRLPLFADLRDVRKRLSNAKYFQCGSNEVQSWYSDANNLQTVSEEAIKISSNDLLDDILNQTNENVTEPRSQNSDSSELSHLIRKLVKPHLIQIDTAEQSNLLMIVDEVISDLMRKILHHPQFQALESAWRGAYFLVRGVETNSDLKIFMLDISKSELSNNLRSLNDLEDSLFFQIVTEDVGGSDGKPWAVVCGNYTFSLNVDDVATLLRIAKISNNASTPFISHIKPQMFGFGTFNENSNSENWKFSENLPEGKLWSFLRKSSEVTHLGLAMPCILARLPYGDKTEPTEAFSFEEFKEHIKHEKYLWFNPCFFTALLLANTFREYGWNISQNLFQDIEGLPMHIYQDETESKTKPCAEILMTQNNCERIIEQGLIPLISFKDTDKIRLGRLQSIAHPFSVLRGRWS